MLNYIKYFLLILAILFQKNSIAQQNKIDSLQILLKKDNADTSKLMHLLRIGEIYEETGNYPDGLNYGKQGLGLAEFLLKKSEKTNDEKIKWAVKKYKAAIYNNIGIIYSDKGEYPEALKNQLLSLRINEEIGSQLGQSISYNGIGTVYYLQGDYPQALKNFYASLKLSELLDYKAGMASVYGNIGFIYYNQGKYEEAIKNQSFAIKANQEAGNKAGVASAYSLMAMIYFDQGNYPEVYKNFLASLKLYEDLGNKQQMASVLANIAAVYIQEKDYTQAIKYLLKAEKISKEIGNKEILQNVYQGFTEVDSAKGNFKEAYIHHKMYTLYKDSLVNEETKRQTIQSQMTFDFEKKEAISKAEYKGELEKQNLLAEEKSRKQKIVTWSVIVGLLVVLAFASFIFRSLRVTRKQKQIIEIKNKETESQKNIIEEKHKEITDSINYAERIQRSFLASKSILDENLKDYFVYFQPKDVVSGDFYWASKLNNGGFVLVTADSTGHGVPGAIMSILNISSLEKAVEQNIQDPSEILNHTRQTIIERLKKDGSVEGGKDGMDCSLICFDFDFENKKMTFAAANNPVWVIRNTGDNNIELIEFKADKMPVGKHDKDSQSFTKQEFQLLKNDVVYTLTDGLPDQFGGAKGKKFMYKQFKETLIEINNLSMAEQKSTIQNRLADWKADYEQVDDILVIGVRI